MNDTNRKTDRAIMAGHGKLMAYMMGWRRGSSGAAVNDEQMANADFVKGHTDGRKAVSDAYGKASRKYKAELSPLR